MTPENRDLIRQAFLHVRERESWTPSRLAEGRERMLQKRTRRRIVRGGAFVASALAVVMLIVMRAPEELPDTLASSTVAPAPAQVEDIASGELTDGALLLSDGSFAEPLTAETALAVEADASDEVRIVLLDGAARFDVVPNPSRTFVVNVRGLRVEVIGTRFEVEVEGAHCHVRVLRGHVRVTWTRGRRDLLAGQSGLFPLADEGGVMPSPVILAEPIEFGATPSEPTGTTTPLTANNGPRVAATGDWRQLARAGDYDSAFRASREQTVGSTIDDLWLAADASRLSGHPREAVGYLEQALTQHPSDGRVHLAAFTLGRLHLQLSQPQQAASDFARVERLDRRGVLVEQALAREVEAWSRAGDTGRARERASSYLRRFPQGTYAERVRRFSTPP